MFLANSFFFFYKFFKVCLFGSFCLKEKKVSSIFLNTFETEIFAKFLENLKKRLVLNKRDSMDLSEK